MEPRDGERVVLFERAGVTVVRISVSGLDGRGVLDTLGEAARLIRSRPPGSVRTLVDLEDRQFGRPFLVEDYDALVIEGIKSYTVRNKPYIHAAAVVVRPDTTNRRFLALMAGISGRNWEIFETPEAALMWLVEQ